MARSSGFRTHALELESSGIANLSSQVAASIAAQVPFARLAARWRSSSRTEPVQKMMVRRVDVAYGATIDRRTSPVANDRHIC